MRSNSFLFSVFLFVIFTSCKGDVSLSDYSEYIGNIENNIVQSRVVNGIRISVRYIPAELDIFKEIRKNEDYNSSDYDSLLKDRTGSVMFWLSFEPEEVKSGEVNDVMLKGISDYQQYNERFLSMNFDLKENIRLKTSNGEYEPIYALLENTFDVESGRKAIVFFATDSDELEIEKADHWEFIYSDDTFGVGTLHFLFRKEEIVKIPTCNFRQILSDEKK